MHFGIGLYPYADGSWDALLDVAQRAERLRFEAVFAFDHVLRPDISYRMPCTLPSPHRPGV